MQEVKNMKVACAIIWSDDRILVTQRGPDMSLPMKWEFPGGKIEKNETAEECVVREIKEELNIEIDVTGSLTEHFYNYGDFSISLFPVIAVFRSGQVKLLEHSRFLWLRKDELLSLDWAEADKEIVRLLIISQNN